MMVGTMAKGATSEHALPARLEPAKCGKGKDGGEGREGREAPGVVWGGGGRARRRSGISAVFEKHPGWEGCF
jgi:hypothetical protein